MVGKARAAKHWPKGLLDGAAARRPPSIRCTSVHGVLFSPQSHPCVHPCMTNRCVMTQTSPHPACSLCAPCGIPAALCVFPPSGCFASAHPAWPVCPDGTPPCKIAPGQHKTLHQFRAAAWVRGQRGRCRPAQQRTTPCPASCRTCCACGRKGKRRGRRQAARTR